MNHRSFLERTKALLMTLCFGQMTHKYKFNIKKARKYLDRPTQTTNKYNTINIFSDSKGNYLRPETEPTNINVIVG